MRKREKVDESWEVRYPERRDGGGPMRLWSRFDWSKEAHSKARQVRASGLVGVKVIRVTRYRLAPLQPVNAKWHYNRREVSWSVITGPCSAFVEQREREWAWHLCGVTGDHTIFDLRGVVDSFSGYAAFVAVSEAARVMGFKLPKMPEGA